MFPPPPHNFILFELDFDIKFPLLRLLLILSGLKSNILMIVLKIYYLQFKSDLVWRTHLIRILKLIISMHPTRMFT